MDSHAEIAAQVSPVICAAPASKLSHMPLWRQSGPCTLQTHHPTGYTCFQVDMNIEVCRAFGFVVEDYHSFSILHCSKIHSIIQVTELLSDFPGQSWMKLCVWDVANT